MSFGGVAVAVAVASGICAGVVQYNVRRGPFEDQISCWFATSMMSGVTCNLLARQPWAQWSLLHGVSYSTTIWACHLLCNTTTAAKITDPAPIVERKINHHDVSKMIVDTAFQGMMCIFPISLGWFYAYAAGWLQNQCNVHLSALSLQ